MSYFGFLLIFLITPIFLLLGLAWWDKRQSREIPAAFSGWPIWAAIALHVAIALVYTTPWDNYLVATRVWWYDPQLVTGLTLGWVPIEEYTFFILQPILGGLWLWFLLRHISVADQGGQHHARIWSVGVLGTFWLTAILVLAVNWQPGTYIALLLGWALPPIMMQLGFGADILWRYRRLVILAIAPLTLYLSLADALAINWGTWTIDPAQSLNIFLGGVLPVEEFIFFLVTNTLITFGIVLLLAEASHQRIAEIRNLKIFSKRTSTTNVR